MNGSRAGGKKVSYGGGLSVLPRIISVQERKLHADKINSDCDFLFVPFLSLIARESKKNR